MTNILKTEFTLDDVGGILTEPIGQYIAYDFRALDKYCSERGIIPSDLTENELKQFELK